MSGPRRADLPSIATLGTVLVVLGAVVLASGPYWQYIATIGVGQAIVGLSIGVIWGTAGMLSVAQLSFAAIGAWTVGTLTAQYGILPAPLAIVAGAVVAVPIGLLVSLPALRLRGINLAVVTLGFAILVHDLAGGGLVPGTSTNLFVAMPASMNSPAAIFVVAWVSLLLLATGTILLRRSRWGLQWQAIARSERAAASLGVSIVRSKMSAFAVSSFIAGWAGGVLITAYGTPDAGTYSPLNALLFFVLAVLFGAGYWEGALALGALNTILSAVLRQFDVSPDIGSILFGIAAVQVLSTGSKAGFSGDVRKLLAKVRRRRPQAEVPVTALLTAPREVPPNSTGRAGRRLEVSGLTVAYGAVVALDDVDLTVPSDAVVGLVGPNGAGKSSLIDAITGYTAPRAGSLRVGGQDLSTLPVFKRSALVRRTFQSERTMEGLTARDYLRLASPPGTPATAVEEILEFTGLAAPDEQLRHLDVRSRRLLMIGGCLIARPAVVLLDEPAAGLDADESVDLASRIVEIPARFGCGVLLIEHDMDLVRLACSSVTVLDFGKVLAAGATDEVLRNPAVAKAYLGEEEEVDA